MALPMTAFDHAASISASGSWCNVNASTSRAYELVYEPEPEDEPVNVSCS